MSARIETPEQHRVALDRLEHAINREEELTVSERVEFEALAEAVESYEKLHFPIAEATVEELAAFRKEQEGP